MRVPSLYHHRPHAETPVLEKLCQQGRDHSVERWLEAPMQMDDDGVAAHGETP